MKRFFSLALMAAVIMIIMPPTVVTAADVKIGVIDTQRIMMQSKTTADIRANFLKELDSKKDLLIEKQKAAQMLDEELKTKAEEMTYETRRDKADLLAKKAKELKRMREEIEMEAKSKDEELSRKFLREIGEIVREYQKKEKFTIIFEKSTIVASDESIDITDKIIQIYDTVK
jgi:outer membrane protein